MVLRYINKNDVHKKVKNEVNQNLANIKSSTLECNNKKFNASKNILHLTKKISKIISMKVRTTKSKMKDLNPFKSRKSLSERCKQLEMQNKQLQCELAITITKNKELTKLATIDNLTGLYNRNYFDQRFKEEIKRERRNKTELSILIIDGDKFKLINDKYGHKVGDKALQAIADSMKEEARLSDICFRIGGDEFCILLPNTDKEGAQCLANRVKSKLDEKVIMFEGEVVKVSVSIGIECLSHDYLKGKNEIEILDEIFNSADKDLYTEKSKRDAMN